MAAPYANLFSPGFKIWACLTPLLIAGFLLVGCTDDDDDDSPTQVQERDIVEQLAADPRFDTLVTAVEAAGLTQTLKGAGPFTVFAPIDSAFADLPAGTLDSLLADPPAELEPILLYHVAPDSLPASAVLQRDMIGTVQGDSISVTVQDSLVFLNVTNQIIETDIQASNGVIHAIRGVLIP